MAPASGKSKLSDELADDMIRNLTENAKKPDAKDDRDEKRSRKVKPFKFKGGEPTPPPLKEDGTLDEVKP